MPLFERIKNQFRKRLINQIRKFKLRKIKLLPIENIIFSENSSEHWNLLDVEGMNVLDLGCGRYLVENISESSPVYFKNKNANKIIGVDYDDKEVKFFNSYFSRVYKDESIFLKKFINSSKKLSSLITEHSVNTIKCDIEGSEIYLFKLKLQCYPSIRQVSIEYHSPLLLKELLNINNLEWKFNIINHSIFSRQRNMGVVTLSKANPEDLRIPSRLNKSGILQQA